LALFVQHVLGKDLFRDGQRPLAGLDRGQKDSLVRTVALRCGTRLQSSDIEWEQPTVFDHLPGDVVFTRREFTQRDLLAGANPVDQTEVGRGENAQVLAVLLVNALDVFSDHQLDAGAQLGIGRLLAAGTFAPALAADGGNKPAFLDVATLDGDFIAAFQAGVRKLAQRFVKEKADVSRGDLVGGDVVTQLGIVSGILGVPRQVFSRELPPNQLRVFGQKEYASLELDLIRPFLDATIEKRGFHKKILARLGSFCRSLLAEPPEDSVRRQSRAGTGPANSKHTAGV